MSEIKFGIVEFALGCALSAFVGYTMHPVLNAPPQEVPVQIQVDEPEKPPVLDGEFVPEIGFPPMIRQ